VPYTQVILPSKAYPKAIFSLVDSAWKSQIIISLSIVSKNSFVKVNGFLTSSFWKLVPTFEIQ